MQLRAPWAVLEGLLSASELVIEKADAIGSILPLYETKGFGFSDLMIRQAARRSGSHHLPMRAFF